MELLADCYRTHAALVRSYLRRLVPPADIDDMTQVVFLEVWQSRHRYDPARSLEAWLLGIARNRAVDHLRARRPATVPLEAVGEPAGDDGRTVSDGLARRDLVRRALSELPETQRQAIELAYYGQLTQREISERLRVPLGTVKARTARGLHRLSALMEAA
ncbi:sigma-70 family RNA polymerase sigma factor [Nonomuraea muscovyensis]|uniref:RNA polymerase sigma-70 factor (ECF subfamily) n=1 Tax=Nonomuraea muscovyensis TaxID=1124761 RepID=A0A7X0F1L1_9ACTN|nr:sigma-70 family RNA polymerase sigma factor [Nonomuraea muscovyensis]MBB6349684.1 RNA polymerase sigma-70 factor (ECF subfamily) [Nonomuraea muscovyensis]MDF2709700.1 polymerase, sigma-24 subunit, subfamily [Nonomuraea muscovyensis]